MMDVKHAIRMAAMAAAFALLGGCAFGNKISYSGARPDIAVKGDKTLALATHDQRVDVVSGNKGPQYVGVMRSMYGIPYNINTPGDVPLADEMSASLERAFAERGFKPTVVKVAYNSSRHAVQESLQQVGAERQVLITLRDWHTDKYFGASLQYDVDVAVFDKDGNELASESFKGDEDIGKMEPPLAFQLKAAEWFARPSIVAALR